MLVSDMIKRLQQLDPDSVIVILHDDGGWCNIGEVTTHNGEPVITTDFTLPFSSE